LYKQKKQKALLALKRVLGYSSDDQFSILLLVLKDYNIVHKLRAIIANNAAPNNVLCCTIESYIKEEEDRE
jgi:hypothetical protein